MEARARALERLADTGALAVQFCNVPCKVLHRAGYVALAHAVDTVDVASALAAVGNVGTQTSKTRGSSISIFALPCILRTFVYVFPVEHYYNGSGNC